ncbi:hypothetical protein MASR2M12_03970 [Bacteroidales bacterium]
MEMNDFQWNDEYSINVFVDKDHRRLIDIIGKLANHIYNSGSKNEFAKILSDMTDYAMQHFKKEEIYMQDFNYPLLKEHKSFHKKYIISTLKYNLAILNDDETDPAQIVQFLSNWWATHIMVSDAAYERYKLENHSDAVYGEDEL